MVVCVAWCGCDASHGGVDGKLVVCGAGILAQRQCAAHRVRGDARACDQCALWRVALAPKPFNGARACGMAAATALANPCAANREPSSHSCWCPPRQDSAAHARAGRRGAPGAQATPGHTLRVWPHSPHTHALHPPRGSQPSRPPPRPHHRSAQAARRLITSHQWPSCAATDALATPGVRRPPPQQTGRRGAQARTHPCSG